MQINVRYKCGTCGGAGCPINVSMNDNAFEADTAACKDGWVECWIDCDQLEMFVEATKAKRNELTPEQKEKAKKKASWERLKLIHGERS